MSSSEEAVTFACGGEQLVGVASLPAQPAALGVVIVVGGPQYRGGSHRQFVLLARRAAAAGFPVLRFDVRGMGDSDGALRSFEQLAPDIGAAIDALQRAAPGVQRVVLWGLCDGASAALLYLGDSGQDPRVAGLCLLNPWVRSAQTLASTQVKHYYTQRLLQPAFWAKLLRGGVAWHAARDLLRSVRAAAVRAPRGGTAAAAAAFPVRMAQQWQRFGGRILLVLSGNDYTAKEFLEAAASVPAWHGALQRPNVQRLDLPTADHTLSDGGHRQQAEDGFVHWLRQLADKNQGGPVARSTPPTASERVSSHATH